jgi:hypothetical protein
MYMYGRVHTYLVMGYTFERHVYKGVTYINIY